MTKPIKRVRERRKEMKYSVNQQHLNNKLLSFPQLRDFRVISMTLLSNKLTIISCKGATLPELIASELSLANLIISILSRFSPKIKEKIPQNKLRPMKKRIFSGPVRPS